MDKMHLAVHFGSGEVFVACFRRTPFPSACPAPPLYPFAFRSLPALRLLLPSRLFIPPLYPFSTLLFRPYDKKMVLFCRFAEANFFATWGNAEKFPYVS